MAELLSDAQLAEAVRRGWLRPPVVSGVPPRKPDAHLEEILADLDRGGEDR